MSERITLVIESDNPNSGWSDTMLADLLTVVRAKGPVTVSYELATVAFSSHDETIVAFETGKVTVLE